MKKLFTLVACLVTLNATFAQWVYKTVDNGIDIPYKIAYSMDKENKAVLKLEKTDEGIAFYVTGGYFCDEYFNVDISILVNNQYKKYSLAAYKSSDSKTVFLIDNLLDFDKSDFLADFKKGSSLVMRINESHCDSEYYRFNITNSSSAIQFMR